jgi:methionyl-tRNA synthetase
LAKLAATKTINNGMNENMKPQKSSVTFDEFTKMDIRVGTVLEAQKVPKANKLLQLKIDTGVDVRTVVSGIAEYFEPEKIIGKQVSILINLEPRTIRGIDSQGMILMAEDTSGKLTFISPTENTENGLEIK